MDESLSLAVFLERLSCRPIPQLSMHDKGRLHDASLALRVLERRNRRRNEEAARRGKPAIAKDNRVKPLEREADEVNE
jgi:hypothetical protein